MRTKLFASVAFAALILPSAAYAQSTGSTDFEGETEIVVTGTATARSVGGVQLPDTPKSKVTIDSELIQRQRPGQTVNDIINLSPGVSFQNNDATGAAGGTFTIRGFDSTRISQTIDGVPLNDTGNYAIYSNQQQDPETLESVTVNLGSTDVDSPTASASGGTVNIRTRVPGEELGALFSGMVGTYAAEGSPAGKRNFYRGFAMIDTGSLTSFGTRAFVSASWVNGDNPFNNYGQLQKAQWNGRIYQPIGSNGDFISVAGHYNQNRNNFFGSAPLRTDLTSVPVNGTPRVVGTGTANRFPTTRNERFYNINYPCATTTARAGLVDNANTCGIEFDRRYNPSNTGNIRVASRFTLAEGLTLTTDASFQYVKANGGGVVGAREGCTTLGNSPTVGACGANTYTGVLNAGPNGGNASPGGFGTYVGRDLNGDGDTLDTVELGNPSETTTRRYVVVSTLAYDINDDNRIRINYTYDRGRHRQTGEHVLLAPNGEPYDVFPINQPVLDGQGNPIQKRDRLSYATLQQLSGEYRGQFGGLTVVLGITNKWFTRDLNQHCFTVAANGNVACVDPAQVAAYAAANPYTYFGPGVTTVGAVTRPAGVCTTSVTCVVGFAPPSSRTYTYSKLLPSVGLTFDVTGDLSLFASYTKGISVPGTDILYNAFYFPVGADQAKPLAEGTDSFDGGFRYRHGRLTAQLSGWYTAYKNRIATAYDPELDQTITRNLGDVTKWGFDGSIAYKPTPDLLIYVFGSYLHSEIKDNLLIGNFDTDFNGATPNVPVYYLTAGKRESGAPVYTFGGRIQGTLGPVDIGLQVKRTGKRYVNDENLAVFQCFNTAGTGNGSVRNGDFCANSSSTTGAGRLVQVYNAAAPAYTLVDLDVRVNMEQWGLSKTYLQFNVTNLFDQFYVGGFGGSSNRFSVPNVQFGVPRAVTAALVVGF
ncbi:TonB-dependent receptor [Sphingomonas sp. LB-2]|uniref:TonB-dependent receptor n=1 Tax=Sphingomonas caeni TaxID=2984949 RepID=UPI002231EF97|nr:TonB-dependent receptor [Sphingomonas caeni]MCW3846169.1 TonB-dependent receptor [Sphingomonas caeni]